MGNIERKHLMPKMDHDALFERLRKSGAAVVGPKFAAVTAYNLGLQDGIDAAAAHYEGAVDALRAAHRYLGREVERLRELHAKDYAELVAHAEEVERLREALTDVTQAQCITDAWLIAGNALKGAPWKGDDA